MKAQSEVSEIERAFERFVDSGYDARRFTNALYNALRTSFTFIAHYDRGGFWRARFETPENRIVTFAEMLRATPWPARPIEVALRAIAVRRGLHEKSDERIRYGGREERARRARAAQGEIRGPTMIYVDDIEEPALALVRDGWKGVSNKYRMISRLPAGQTGLQALRASAPSTYRELSERFEREAADIYRRTCSSESAGTQRTLSVDEWIAFKRAGGESSW